MELHNKPVERLIMKSYQCPSKQISEHNRLIFINPPQKKQIEYYTKNKLKLKINVPYGKKI